MPYPTPPDKPDAGIAAAPPWRLALATAGLFAALAAPAFWTASPGLPFIVPTLLLGAVLIWLSVIDIGSYRLPDALTLPLLAAGLAFSYLFQWDDLRWRVAASALGFGLLYAVAWFYFKLRGRHGLGLGDAKLLAASGAWLGVEGVPATLLLASCSALCAALVSAFAGRPVAADTRMPFGPFLALGTWLTWLYGPLV